MSCVALVSCGLGVAAAMLAGGTGGVIVAVALLLAFASSLSILPLLGAPMVTPSNWGLVVLGTSAGRTLIAMGGMLVLIQVSGLPNRPVVMGVLAGAVLTMICETVVAVTLLNRRERLRSAHTHSVSATAATAASSGSHS